MKDKCICINDYYDKYNNNLPHLPHYKKGYYYEFTDEKFVTRELPEGYNVQFSKGEYLFFRKYQDILAEKGYGMFSTYFKPIKEIRKEKLKKLEECQKYL